MYGRRRIGKTRILQEITKKHHAIYYVFNEMGLEHNLEHLSRVIAEYFNLPISFDCLEQLFEFLARKTQEVRSVVNYEKILNAIAAGATRMNEISNKSGIRSSKTTSNYLEILQNLSIVEKIPKLQ